MGYKIIGDQSPVIGTCALDQDYGTVLNGRLRLGAEVKELKTCEGEIDTAIIRNEKYELEIEALFDSGITEPVLGSATLTIDGHTGQVLEWEKKWEHEGEVSISLKASKWVALGNTPTVTVVP